MRILLVEDDDRIAKPLAEDLRQQHYVVDLARDGIEGWEFTRSAAYDLILLDLMLPKLSGIELCKHLRADRYQGFVLMLTARDTTTDKVITTLPKGSVTLRGSQKGNHVQIKVEDTGIGIAPEHLDRIFDRFWRADQSRAYWSGGSGLGLAIAQGIAQHHNGSIAVSSQLEVGSCFTVKLPAQSAFTA